MKYFTNYISFLTTFGLVSTCLAQAVNEGTPSERIAQFRRAQRELVSIVERIEKSAVSGDDSGSLKALQEKLSTAKREKLMLVIQAIEDQTIHVGMPVSVLKEFFADDFPAPASLIHKPNMTVAAINLFPNRIINEKNSFPIGWVLRIEYTSDEKVAFYYLTDQFKILPSNK